MIPNAIERMMEDFAVMDRVSTPDGEGGFFSEWRDGATFRAALTHDSSMEAKRAERDGVTSVYTVTTPKTARLDYHTAIKRLSDGAIFRITSNPGDEDTPPYASFDLAQVSAERWELTK